MIYRNPIYAGYSNQIDKVYSFVPVSKLESRSRSITFQVTDDCCCACTYCYQINKGHRKMTKDVAKKVINMLFDMYDKNNDTFINHKTQAIILDFIGGEPLMNVELIDYICSTFVDECIKRDHPWQYTWRASMISNGKYYFTEETQKFLNKFKGSISFGITLDGPKEIHDACRIYPDGTGNFNDAYKAFLHYNKHFLQTSTTKMTIAPENLLNLHSVIKFFIENQSNEINLNCIFEHEWTIDEGRLLYQELKKTADYILKIGNDSDIMVSIFDNTIGQSKDLNDDQNWCGGTMGMLSFDPEGLAYPCIRYMSSSLGDERAPLIIGSADGLFVTKEQQDLRDYLESITRITQSTQECIDCPIASGCAWCSAWNYQETGSVNKRSTHICNAHKARVLANVYFWNKAFDQENTNEVFELNLPKEECLKFIDENEYNMLLGLVQKQKDKINQIDN